jgi:frataxin-like iron-binding protein CyaY
MHKNLEEIDWLLEFQDKSAEEAWECFANVLNQQMNSHIPRSVPKKQKRRNIWMTKEGTAKYRQKQRAWKSYKSSGNRIDYIRATTEKNEFS